MTVAFEPSLSPTSTRAPYGAGAVGVRMSLEAMAQKMREGRLDPGVRGWALDCLAKAGLDGRSRQTTPAAQAAALLDGLRSVTVYASDPYGSEYVPSAAATLCLRPNLCVRGDDCDGLSVAYGSLTLSIGIPTMIVKQNFGGGAQEHVLIGVYDGSDWRYADPSTKMPFGSALSAKDETWIDPMEPIGNLPAAQPEIVTLGKPRMENEIVGAALARTPRIGIGTVFGYATVADLTKLLDVAAYDLRQIQTAVAACPGGWPDTAAWTAWKNDLAQAQVDFDVAVKTCEGVINATPHWLAGFNVVTYEWGMVRAVIDECIDLDRRWRVAAPSCQAPVYPDTPQPTVDGDVDQWTYNAANSAVKGIEGAAKNAIQPVVLGLGGIAVGIGVAITASFLLPLLIPRRR
jgi:hypothetical protein